MDKTKTLNVEYNLKQEKDLTNQSVTFFSVNPPQNLLRLPINQRLMTLRPTACWSPGTSQMTMAAPSWDTGLSAVRSTVHTGHVSTGKKTQWQNLFSLLGLKHLVWLNVSAGFLNVPICPGLQEHRPWHSAERWRSAGRANLHIQGGGWEPGWPRKVQCPLWSQDSPGSNLYVHRSKPFIQQNADQCLYIY